MMSVPVRWHFWLRHHIQVDAITSRGFQTDCHSQKASLVMKCFEYHCLVHMTWNVGHLPRGFQIHAALNCCLHLPISGKCSFSICNSEVAILIILGFLYVKYVGKLESSIYVLLQILVCAAQSHLPLLEAESMGRSAFSLIQQGSSFLHILYVVFLFFRKTQYAHTSGVHKCS